MEKLVTLFHYNTLESVETALSQANLTEITEIREELIQTGFIRRRQRSWLSSSFSI